MMQLPNAVKRILLDEETIAARVRELAAQISADYTDAGGNVSVDPLFVDTDTYHLQSRGGCYTGGFFAGGAWDTVSGTSPCLDAGDPAADFCREPKPNGGRVNLGAYGNTHVASKLPLLGAVLVVR